MYFVLYKIKTMQFFLNKVVILKEIKYQIKFNSNDKIQFIQFIYII